jgi:putative transposase
MKHRCGVLHHAMLRCRQTAMRKACEAFGAELREFNAEADHVHLLVHCPPNAPISALVNSLSGQQVG